MAKYTRESLEKLLSLIGEICSQEENLWFKERLLGSGANILVNENVTSDSINRIYEYCIKEIISKQANNFYNDFILSDIKNELISDFIRMEHFRRDDNFEDFCLAMFQQIENIVVYLFTYFSLDKKIITDYNKRIIYIYSKEEKKFIPSTTGIYLSNFIFQKYKQETPFQIKDNEFYFNNKFRAIVYYFYFKEIIEFNTIKFDDIYNIGNYLYQMRNLNHRGGEKSDFQQKIIDEIIPNHNKYYFKFLGFLEMFVSVINNNLRNIS
jgi:hypothetical protein